MGTTVVLTRRAATVVRAARAPRTAARADKLAAWGTVTAEVAMAGAGG